MWYSAGNIAVQAVTVQGDRVISVTWSSVQRIKNSN